MYNEINAFGHIVSRGQSVRVAFDSNMGHVGSELGASFVLEFTLQNNGHVHLRQAGASKETGLTLTTVRGKQEVELGKFIELSSLLRFQYGEIEHPRRAGVLSFKHRQTAGKLVFSLSWHAGTVQASPAPAAAPVSTSDFRPARGFNKIVAPAQQAQLSGGLWFPIFATSDEALAFCRYVGGFARRVAPGAVTRSRPVWSQIRLGFIARLSVQFPGWGEEEGVVMCRENEVAGLALEQNSKWVLMPVKQYSHALRTQSGTLYVLFTDGTAFCRPNSDGACEMADALYFARSPREARAVHENGGSLEVTRVPTTGYVPLYVTGGARAVGNSVDLGARSFRLGTAVASVIAA